MNVEANPNYVVKLTNREDLAEGTMAFRFEKPAHFEFTPGQFVDMTLVHPSETDAEGDTRAFSIASAPHEETLMVATRMRDTAFKRVLRSMPLGTEVRIEGPMGNLVLHADPARPAVLLAGGIGITRSGASSFTRRRKNCRTLSSSSIRTGGRKMLRSWTNCRPYNGTISTTPSSGP